MGDTRNLQKFGDGSRTPEEEFEIRSKGGKASGAARRLKRSMKEVLILALEVIDKESGKSKQELGIDRLVEMFAETGDIRAYEAICKTLGETVEAAPVKVVFENDELEELSE